MLVKSSWEDVKYVCISILFLFFFLHFPRLILTLTCIVLHVSIKEDDATFTAQVQRIKQWTEIKSLHTVCLTVLKFCPWRHTGFLYCRLRWNKGGGCHIFLFLLSFDESHLCWLQTYFHNIWCQNTYLSKISAGSRSTLELIQWEKASNCIWSKLNSRALSSCARKHSEVNQSVSV